MEKNSQIKLNLGCASKLLEGYINIDQDDINVIRARYPWIEFPEDAHVYTYDVFNLPYENEMFDAGSSRLVNNMLDNRTIDDWQHFLRDCLCCR